MKIIKISDSRRLNLSSIVVGYSQENKIEKIAFEIPDEYKEFGRKACFEGNGTKFAKTFDNVTGDTLTLTRDMTQFKELKMSIAFFKVENEDEIVARTSILNITIEDAIVCDDDIKPDDPKIVILDNLITRVTELDNQITQNENFRQANEKTREENEAIRQQNEAVRKKNEQTWINNELLREKAENDRKNNELKRIANENKRVSDENARQEYMNNLKTQVDSGDFDGADFNYKWDGTKLGVKNSKETTYQFVELKGQKGDKGNKGDTGNGIQNIEKVSTLENVDTYAINYTDGTQTTFDVTNGEVTKEQLDEVDSKAKKTRDELERVKNDILETGTASDSFINVQDSAMAEYQELSVDGVCEQVTTTGKNLLYPGNLESVTKNGITFTPVYDENGSLQFINIKGIATSDVNYSLSRNTLPAGSYIYNGVTGGSTTTYYGSLNWKGLTDGDVSQTLSEETEMAYTIYVKNGVTVNNVKVYPMIRLASITDDTYEPYTGGQPSPNPDYPQEIKTIENSFKITSCNKNLIPYMEKGDINSNGEEINSTTVLRSGFIKVKPNTTYISSYNNKEQNVTYYCYDKNKQKIGTSSFKSKYTTSDNAEYIRFRIYNNNYDISLFQIEQSDNFTSFEQHLETQIEANLGDEFIGKINDTYKDTLKVEYNEDDGQYHLNLYKNIGRAVLNGSENWSISSSGGLTRFASQEINSAINSPNRSIMLSNYFKYISSGDVIGGGFIYNQQFFAYPNQDIKTVADFKTWLSENNVTVYYQLATPYTLDLGVVDQLITYNEITNLFTDSDLLPQINAKYYRNFISTVRNLQVNEKALKQELIDINARLSALESASVSVTSESEVVE